MDTGPNQIEKYKKQAKDGLDDVAKSLSVGLKVTGASSSGAYGSPLEVSLNQRKQRQLKQKVQQ